MPPTLALVPPAPPDPAPPARPPLTPEQAARAAAWYAMQDEEAARRGLPPRDAG